MNTDSGKVRQVIRGVGLAGACAVLAGPMVFGTAASSSNSRRDVRIDIPSNVATAAGADRTLVTDAASELKKDESFTSETKVVEYRFRLDSSADLVHLDISAEVEHGLVCWELIDPTGEVRASIRTTEPASMNTSNIQAIKGEWLLRVTLQNATGRYHVSWIR
jgi:hypothetical protein